MEARRRARLGPRRVVAIALPALIALGCAATTSQARGRSPAPKWHTFMPAEAMGARAFVGAHPTWDGRGVVVAVLDTGVDPRATGLHKTSTGVVKVIEARDFSGQGDVALAPAEVLEGPGGRLRNHHAELSGVHKLKEVPTDGRWLLGAFSEKRIGPSKLRDVNHDGRKDGKVAVLIWRVGTGESGLRVAMDLDGDGSIAGEKVVRPYHVKQELHSGSHGPAQVCRIWPSTRRNASSWAMTAPRWRTVSCTLLGCFGGRAVGAGSGRPKSNSTSADPLWGALTGSSPQMVRGAGCRWPICRARACT